MKRFPLVVSIGLAILFFTCSVFCQEEEIVEYSYGIVAGVNSSGKEIVINEYDWEKGEEVAVTYSVASDTKFENVNSLKEIVHGLEVTIDYVKGKNDKKIIRYISVYKAEVGSEQTEDIPDAPKVED